MPPSPAPDTSPRLPPFWWVALLSLIVTIGVNALMFSHYAGKQDGRVTALEKRVDTLEEEKARRQTRELEKVYEYEKAQATKLAELEAIARNLRQSAPPR